MPNSLAEWICRTLVHMLKEVADMKAAYIRSIAAFIVKCKVFDDTADPTKIKTIEPTKNWIPVNKKPFMPLPYFLTKTVQKAFIDVDMMMKPSPVSFIASPPIGFPVLVITIPIVPMIRARIIFELILSSGKSRAENITTMKELAAWIIEDLTPKVFDRPI